jgi:hypothetical protein
LRRRPDTTKSAGPRPEGEKAVTTRGVKGKKELTYTGGSGNGPRYVEGPGEVIGSDIYRLDTDHDGIGCADGWPISCLRLLI